MQKLLLLLCLSVVLLSCKKTVIDEIEEDSFRISILPIQTSGFNQHIISGTLEVRKTDSDIEYGLVISKALNPTVENSKKYKIGGSMNSIDFTQQLTDLDTGSVYYVRAYGKVNAVIEYSANQMIGKVSPQILSVDNNLNYGRPLLILTNINTLTAQSPVKVFLNATELAVTSVSASNVGSAITAQISSQLTPGEYTLTVTINSLSLVYQKKLTLLEGNWQQLENLPSDNGGMVGTADYFISGDWIYTYRVASQHISTIAEFNKYNYKTRQQVFLTPYDPIYRLEKSAILQEGSNVHLIGGDRIGGYQNAITTKSHYVYDMTTDSWIKEADFPGGERRNPVAFVTNNKLFIGMGYKSGSFSAIPSPTTYYTDFWSYELTTKVWKKLSDFPQSKGRLLSGSFAIGSKLYITGGGAGQTGDNASAVVSKETWCYDTSTDQWTRKADYPGKGEMAFTNFSIGNFGYVGLGESLSYDSYYGKKLDTQFFKYDPASDKWTEVSNPNQRISLGMSGTNGIQGFAGGGNDASGAPNKTLYVFTP
jgi:N-acetylneuraminic acid mutarotase